MPAFPSHRPRRSQAVIGILEDCAEAARTIGETETFTVKLLTEDLCSVENDAGMYAMDGCLLKLFRAGVITKDTALTYCVYHENMQKRLAVLS